MSNKSENDKNHDQKGSEGSANGLEGLRLKKGIDLFNDLERSDMSPNF